MATDIETAWAHLLIHLDGCEEDEAEVRDRITELGGG